MTRIKSLILLETKLGHSNLKGSFLLSLVFLVLSVRMLIVLRQLQGGVYVQYHILECLEVSFASGFP